MNDPYWPFDGPRSFLFVSSSQPDGAAAAVRRWPEGPPDLCVTSPSPAARQTVEIACAGRYVDVEEEPILGVRGSHESDSDLEARRADVFRLLHELVGRAVLVVSDDLFDASELPFAAPADDLLRRAATIERALRLA